MATPALMIEKLKGLGANVKQIGDHWTEADKFLREELLAKDPNGVYVPPFDHPDVWEGHATLVEEVEQQMAQEGVSMDAIVCSVGGGGLFAGIMQGLEQNGRLGSNGVKILALETKGADSLSYSLQRGELSRLPAITSIATSLGATQVAKAAYEYATKYANLVKSCVLSDAEAAMACVAFAEDERMIVESACGVSIAAVYDGSLQEVLYPELSDAEFQEKNVVIVVCGGSNVSLEILEKYKQTYGKDEAVLAKFHQRYQKSLKAKVVPSEA
jgi:L-serine/L-threonine ammonia-lyase